MEHQKLQAKLDSLSASAANVPAPTSPTLALSHDSLDALTGSGGGCVSGERGMLSEKAPSASMNSLTGSMNGSISRDADKHRLTIELTENKTRLRKIRQELYASPSESSTCPAFGPVLPLEPCPRSRTSRIQISIN